MAKSKYQKYLPIGIAVAAGALLLYYSSKASAQPKPVGPVPDPDQPQPVVPPVVEPDKPSGGASQKKNAPSFPHSLAEAKALEHGQATAEHAQWMAHMSGVMEGNDSPGPNPTEEDYAEGRSSAGIPKHRTIAGALTDEAFDVLYGKGMTIPPKSKRGSGWQPYIDSWTRMSDYLKGQTWVSG